MILVSSYISTISLMDITKIAWVSQINSQIFSTLLSLLVAFFASFLLFSSDFNKKELLEIKKQHFFILAFLLAVVAGVCFIRFDAYSVYGSMVFQDWRQIPLLDLASTVLFYCFLLYVPVHVLHRNLFHRFRLDFLKKLVFYPMVSMLIFGFASFMLPSFKEALYLKLLVPVLLIGLLVFTFIHIFRGREWKPVRVTSANLTEILGLTLIILFRLFIQYSAIGGIDAFIKGDTTGTVANVGFINKQGFVGYLNAPLTERYPVFFAAAWAVITQLLPLPYCNTLIIVEFFNNVFVTLAFYLLAKTLFTHTRESLFATLLLTVLSGFSWFYVLTNPPPSFLSGNEFHDYIWEVVNKFGTESGAKVSMIYADDHALNRLWSLGLCFGSVAAPLNERHSINRGRGYLLIFSAGFLQIALGHSTELILLGFTLFAFTILTSKKSTKEILFAVGVSTLLSVFFMWMFGYFIITFQVISLPLLALIFAVLLKRFINSKYISWKFISFHKRTILNVLTIMFICYYGLSWIGFLSMYHQIQIAVPLFTLWYSPPIQWGFLGLLFTIFMAKCVLTRWKDLDFCLKFIMLMFSLLIFLTVFVNYFNLHFLYLNVPANFMPYYFLPFLALASVYILRDMNFPKMKRLEVNIKPTLLVTLVVLMLLFGSFTHILSASYWKTSGWQTERSPLTSLSDGEIQFVNFLYNLSSRTPLSGVLSKDQPFPPVEESEFQTMVRYRLYDVDYLIMLSGIRIPQKLAMSMLYDTQDLNEIIFLNQIYPMEYLIVDRDATSFLAHFMRENEFPLFDGKYIVYDLSNLQSVREDNSKIQDAILVDEVLFTGNLTFTDQKHQKTLLNNVTGALSPLENGYTSVNIFQWDDDQTGYREESNADLKDGESGDSEMCIYHNETFWGWSEYGSGNQAVLARLDETTNKVEVSNSLEVKISEVKIEGETTLINMRSTSNYFPQAMNVAQKVEIRGEASFKVLNSFDNKRLYIGLFEYVGVEKIYPEPWHMTALVAKQHIQSYIESTDIPFLAVLSSLYGLTWIIICIWFSIIFVFRRVRVTIRLKGKGEKE